ncbi:uncharacterized protein N7479_007044 [Penicillium vulpinum]|uniref:uncharacterized protein n=1 Tax=Penicillium vulpinum TaxID=29845 RepID=UPI0025496737|nr:uncharacterized protein N7479_007044 [Penicillium vulpinum]KAJ5959894.1 hypothetical protein N7479_007044 [Penicillium vulpinum]
MPETSAGVDTGCEVESFGAMNLAKKGRICEYRPMHKLIRIPSLVNIDTWDYDMDSSVPNMLRFAPVHATFVEEISITDHV